MRAAQFVLLTLAAIAGFVFGVLIARPDPISNPSTQEISDAQQASNRFLAPIWQGMFRDQAWLNDLRRRGYLYCYRKQTIAPDCAREQDEAVQNVFFALTVSKAHQKIVDHSRLSLREIEVARNPQLRSRIIRYCSGLYAEHGGQDARVLATCLGNLSEYSPLVPIPVE